MFIHSTRGARCEESRDCILTNPNNSTHTTDIKSQDFRQRLTLTVSKRKVGNQSASLRRGTLEAHVAHANTRTSTCASTCALQGGTCASTRASTCASREEGGTCVRGLYRLPPRRHFGGTRGTCKHTCPHTCLHMCLDMCPPRRHICLHMCLEKGCTCVRALQAPSEEAL